VQCEAREGRRWKSQGGIAEKGGGGDRSSLKKEGTDANEKEGRGGKLLVKNYQTESVRSIKKRGPMGQEKRVRKPRKMGKRGKGKRGRDKGHPPQHKVVRGIAHNHRRWGHGGTAKQTGENVIEKNTNAGNNKKEAKERNRSARAPSSHMV